MKASDGLVCTLKDAEIAKSGFGRTSCAAAFPVLGVENLRLSIVKAEIVHVDYFGSGEAAVKADLTPFRTRHLVENEDLLKLAGAVPYTESEKATATKAMLDMSEDELKAIVEGEILYSAVICTWRTRQGLALHCLCVT